MAVPEAIKGKKAKNKLQPLSLLQRVALAWRPPSVSRCVAYRKQLVQELSDVCDGDDIPFYPEYDVALIGAVRQGHDDAALCYSRARIVRLLMLRDGMDREEAEEFVSFNIDGIGLGKHTPVLLD